MNPIITELVAGYGTYSDASELSMASMDVPAEAATFATFITIKGA